ncbi:NACHT domain-containing protein [Pedobacter jeongneungensis]|uniref:NACHT domain-containing protein n=1 Tax=Pedobacter jeongneungensis TaxID=947309 RepID=UPI0013B3FFE1|nr:hypothetical protein [Pedobacter jeongneungensis]
MKNIKREAGDKTKGFTLQKQRAISLALDELEHVDNVSVNVAIEYKGDVYLQNGKNGYVEEEKNYHKDTKFTLNSNQILNTMVYFLQLWLDSEKSASSRFGFFSTNQIGSEGISDRSKKLDITFPNYSILEKIVTHQVEQDKQDLAILSSFIFDEYKIQYDPTNSPTLNDSELIQFLQQISWQFNQPDEKSYEDILLKKIKSSKFYTDPQNRFAPNHIYAELMLALEKKQDQGDLLQKFLSKADIELAFLKVSQGRRAPEASRYLFFDVTGFAKNAKIQLERLISSKYYANANHQRLPKMAKRKVARHNREIKIDLASLETTKIKQVTQLEVVIKEIGELLDSDKPTFLFGDIGSGKSTLLAQHFVKQLSEENICIFLTAGYLKGKIQSEISTFQKEIEEFVNKELGLAGSYFELDGLLNSGKEITLVVDGVDELSRSEIVNLSTHLLSLSEHQVNIRVVASGRPFEVQKYIHFNDWNCLTTIDLVEEDIFQILENEALAEGLSVQDALTDAKSRLDILKSNPELFGNTTNPLIATLIREFLIAGHSSSTLGDILYEVILKKLSWTVDDNKKDFVNFTQFYPNTFQRLPFISEVAWSIFLSKNRAITDAGLHAAIDKVCAISLDDPNRNLIIDEAIKFVTTTFLQKTTGGLTFQSHQLFQMLVGHHTYTTLAKGETINLGSDSYGQWRIISFVSTVARKIGENATVTDYMKNFLCEILSSESATPIAALLLAESRTDSLNQIFLVRVKQLGFSPLKFWGIDDKQVPNAFGYVFSALGRPGFEWLYENYLSPAHPSKSTSDELPVALLSAFLLHKGFELGDQEKKELFEVAKYHMAAMTFSCQTFLPTIALAIPEYFDVKVRSILVVQSLKKPTLSSRAQEILKKEMTDGNLSHVIEGLEIEIAKDYGKSEALKFWFTITSETPSVSFIEKAVRFVADGDEKLFSILQQRVGKEPLKSFLVYCVLQRNKLSDASAILLYLYYEVREFKLIVPPILEKTSILEYNTEVRLRILDHFFAQAGTEEIEYIIKNRPVPEHDHGISELYLRYFLKCLEVSSAIYQNEFLTVVRFMGKYTLSRYPELREYFNKIISRAEYLSALRYAVTNIDLPLRYNAACLLLIFDPINETKGVEIVIRSTFSRDTDHYEWFRFCSKLNLGKTVLDHIYRLLPELIAVPKIYALKLLFHRGDPRVEGKLLSELVYGLLGEASSLDFSHSLSDDGVENIVRQDRFSELIYAALKDSNFNIRRSAASVIIDRYLDKISIKDQAKAWLLYIDYSPEFGLDSFIKKHIELLENTDFVAQLYEYQKECEEIADKPSFLLIKLYEAINDIETWETFLITSITTRMMFDAHHAYLLYAILVKLSAKQPTIRKKIGSAFKGMMELETFNQHRRNDYIPIFALMAHEFGSLENSSLERILTDFSAVSTETTCALLFRLGNIPQNFHPDIRYTGHINIFSQRKAQEKYLEQSAVDKLLVNGEAIPVSLGRGVETSILLEFYSATDLQELKAQGATAAYFALVLSTSRRMDIGDFDYVDLLDIGGQKYDDRKQTELQRNILRNIMDLQLDQPKKKEAFIKRLTAHLHAIENYLTFEFFDILFETTDKIQSKEFLLFVDVLCDNPDRLNLRQLNNLSELFSLSSGTEKQQITQHLKQKLKSLLNTAPSRNRKGFAMLIWVISLLILSVENELTKDTEDGVLVGLKAIFLQDGAKYEDEEGQLMFKARDMLNYSDGLMEKIEPKIMRSIILAGRESNVVEIRSLCRILSTLAAIEA